MADESEPTRTTAGPVPPRTSSFPSIEEGRFPAGTTLAGRFRILGLLGQGGMGEVYRALDLTLNQPVALKFIARAEHGSEATLARFRNEVRIARQVSHPNVCRVYDIGVIEGLHFLSMEYVDGEDLASLLRRIGRLPSDKALEFARRICAGLSAAHERGVLHRDLKPANIMIDGRGHVRITDFGLAALAGDVHGGEVRSGTPAYMSPEQKSGREVTARSDIYALGLVLHEMFTGKRPGESPSTPSTLVKDLDPTIERVILRCLETDPRSRPASALHVAMALPGGDPIAAALAAGETPSPEMVAASVEKEGLQPRTALACFAGVVLGLVALVMLANSTTLFGRAPLPLPPDALAFKAREMLKELGYTEEPVDTASGFVTGSIRAYWQYHRDHGWRRLASHQPPLTVFFYRQHQNYLQPLFFLPVERQLMHGLVTPGDPPLTARGMVRVALDPAGRLVHLQALPSTTLAPIAGPFRPEASDSWSPLLRAAGLEPARLTSVAPTQFMPVFADSRMAWTRPDEDGRANAIRIEAAALDGRPVSFNIAGPWDEPEVAGPPATRRLANVISATLLIALMIAAAVVAWRNVRLGRGDRKAAARVAAFFFANSIAAWALIAAHVPTMWELYLLVMGLSFAAFVAGFGGLLYLAVEPFVRRYWPDALISLVRLIGGRFRDPLVTSHVLVGITVGIVPALLASVTHFVTGEIATDTRMVIGLSSERILAGLFMATVNGAAWLAGGIIMVLVLLRGVLRRTWLADGLLIVLVSVAFFDAPAMMPATLLTWTAYVWVLRRFGVLALVALACTRLLILNRPLAAVSWDATHALSTPGLIGVAAAWSLYVIVSSRPASASRPAEAGAM